MFIRCSTFLSLIFLPTVHHGHVLLLLLLLVDCLSSFGYLCFTFLLYGYVLHHLSFYCILIYHLLLYNSIPYNVRYITLFSKIFLYYWNAKTIT